MTVHETRLRPSDRRALLRPAALAGLTGTALPHAPAPPAGHVVRVGRRAMASRFEILLPAGEDAVAAFRALDLVSELERRFSVFEPDSEVSRLNRSAFSEPVAVAADLCALLGLAARVAAATGGAFDVAAGALWRCWGLADRRDAPPTPAAITAAMAASGISRVEIDGDHGRVRFLAPGVELNLGAIGKGHAVDRAADLLLAFGHRAALLHAGHSSVRALGDAPGGREGEGWPLTLRDPRGTAETLATLRLRDRAMGVSGVAERHGHLLDPRTGEPARRNALAVAWADDATRADAFSTAFFVMDAAGVAACCRRWPDLGALTVPACAGDEDPACRLFGAVPGSLEIRA